MQKYKLIVVNVLVLGTVSFAAAAPLETVTQPLQPVLQPVVNGAGQSLPPAAPVVSELNQVIWPPSSGAVPPPGNTNQGFSSASDEIALPGDQSTLSTGDTNANSTSAGDSGVSGQVQENPEGNVLTSLPEALGEAISAPLQLAQDAPGAVAILFGALLAAVGALFLLVREPDIHTHD